MKNSQRLNTLESLVNAIAKKLGLTDEQSESATSTSAPKTSARVSSRENVSPMAKKGRAHENVEIVLTDAMIAGRMKLPARMFVKGPKVVIDGHTITQQAQDQNRSSKFNPEIFGYELVAGDTIVFAHVSGREWEVDEVIDGGGKAPSRKPAAKKAASTKPAAKPAKPTAGSSKAKPSVKGGKVKPSGGKPVSQSVPVTKEIRKGIEEFAALCIENNEDEDFEENENIKQTGAFDLDARVMLTTPQSQKFKRFRKAHGMTLSQAVQLLNTEVYE